MTLHHPDQFRTLPTATPPFRSYHHVLSQSLPRAVLMPLTHQQTPDIPAQLLHYNLLPFTVLPTTTEKKLSPTRVETLSLPSARPTRHTVLSAPQANILTRPDSVPITVRTASPCSTDALFTLFSLARSLFYRPDSHSDIFFLH